MSDSPAPGTEPTGETVEQARTRLTLQRQIAELQLNSALLDATNYRAFADFRERMADSYRAEMEAIDVQLAAL
jgi:hypothetical protein